MSLCSHSISCHPHQTCSIKSSLHMPLSCPLNQQSLDNINFLFHLGPASGAGNFWVTWDLLRRALCLIECSAVTILKFLISFEQGTLHFHFTEGSANYVAGPDHHTGNLVFFKEIHVCMYTYKTISFYNNKCLVIVAAFLNDSLLDAHTYQGLE